MGDVTFGVKVSEEMKNELSQLMKEHTLSGKEFMSMLLASYKLDQAREESQLFESDLAELQQLIKRISGLFINMTEKSKISYKEEQEALEKVIAAQKEEKETLVKEKNVLEEALQKVKVKEVEWQEKLAEKDEIIKERTKERDLQKTQLENNLLLHQKFEEEVQRLQEVIEGYKRLEVEIEERNEEITKLKNRNDEMASENWFLQREVEKQQKEKEQMTDKHNIELTNLKSQFELQLKNELLEQKIKQSELIQDLKEEVMRLKEEKLTLMKSKNEQEGK